MVGFGVGGSIGLGFLVEEIGNIYQRRKSIRDSQRKSNIDTEVRDN